MRVINSPAPAKSAACARTAPGPPGAGDRIIDRFDPAMNTPAPRDLAVLFADVSGSTRLYEELGDEVALSTIARCLAVVKRACDGHNGRVIKTIGDEAMAVF